REVKQRIGEMKERIGARRVALSASDGKSVLSDTVATAKAKIETAKQPEAKDTDVDAAVASVEAIAKTLEGQAGLEKKDKSYAVLADRVRNDTIIRLGDALELAKYSRELRKKTGDALAAGASAADSASALTDLRARKAQYEKALGEFRACQSEGASMVASIPQLGKIVVLADGHPSTPKDVMAMCS